MHPRRIVSGFCRFRQSAANMAANGKADAPVRANKKIFFQVDSRQAPDPNHPNWRLKAPCRPTPLAAAESGSVPLRVASSTTMFKAVRPRAIEFCAITLKSSVTSPP